MDGRAFLDVARELAAGGTEAHWRAAVGRAYYALMLECRETLSTWGFRPLRRENVHTFLRLRLSFAIDADLKLIGTTVEQLGRLRNKADYEMGIIAAFTSNHRANQSVAMADDALRVLDQIKTDSARRAAATAAIRAAFP